MNANKNRLLLFPVIALLGLSFLTAKATLADLKWKGAQYYIQSASTQQDADIRQSFLKKGLAQLLQTMALDSTNSFYQLQHALTVDELNAVLGLTEKDNEMSQQAIEYLELGLRNSPTNSELWSQLSKMLYERDGPTVATLAALDKALLLGPNERRALMVNAIITLYSWNQLDEDRQQGGWLLMLDSMIDRKLAPQIRLHTRYTGWEKHLDRALMEKGI